MYNPSLTSYHHHCFVILLSDNSLDIISSPSPLSSIVEGAILHRSACNSIAAEKAWASPAASVTFTLYAADYSLTKDKTVLIIWCLNNLNKTLHVWVASGDLWDNLDNVPALARQLIVLVNTAAKIPGVLGLTVSSNGMSFGEGMAHAFHGFLNCQTVGTATSTHGTADMSSDVNMESKSPLALPSSSLLANKPVLKPA
ncbi:hypothetical protein NP233_g5246 [Leucocoprinus birnbaumii]|uniref:Uncharacterized protein n=1 Tax=Leucocoprinus birnbaumii TaxID=56174 RepID=A0AAD5YWX3_9AGAR|nr:hypothetical protein NP233_g5246 [Leucocoprinus birnbaumii]